MDKQEHENIWKFIKEMNSLWTKENKAHELKNYFHPQMIAIVPNLREKVVGGEACVQGWNYFAQNNEILSWEEHNPRIDVFNNSTSAVVSYDFTMSFKAHGTTIHMEGRDLFFLIKENERWWVVADQFSPMP